MRGANWMYRVTKRWTLFVLLAVLGLLLVPLAGGRQASAQAAVPASWIKGANMINYGPDPYQPQNIPAAVASWKATGGNAIALAPRWVMDNGYANNIYP